MEHKYRIRQIVKGSGDRFYPERLMSVGGWEAIETAWVFNCPVLVGYPTYNEALVVVRKRQQEDVKETIHHYVT